ncbi:MAG TPA: DNA polymerase III subunit alpha [Candidatus Megaira endosymbiont of Nemacystus decipiens]|nr:DNA polymerase III subunit alpha [Candidatus Megaera endosymbiont of Nemacystus decipiens]
MDSNFVHFRVQSSYSMLESSLKVNQIVDIAKDKKMLALCLADRGNLFASLEFSISAAKKQLQPIHGSILNIKYLNKKRERFAEILLIAKDDEGYKNLLKLVSITFTKNERSVCDHITLEDLKIHGSGLILCSAYTNGVIGQLILEKDLEGAEQYAHIFKELAGDRFYFEIMRHGYKDEKKIEEEYLKIASKLNIALLATNHVLFADVQQHEAHDVLLCISNGVVQEEQNRKRVSNQCYFKSAEEMIDLFHDLPEAVENTVNLAKRCYVRPKENAPSLPNFSDGTSSESDLLRVDAKNGLEKRLSIKNTNSLKREQLQEYYNRLEYELEIICKMNFAGYFLIVADFIQWSKNNNIAVGPGRGSGAGSIIAWSLGITDLDPIEFGLLFERFLNPERVSMPDFDIDFCQERREEVISYVRSKYGDDRVAQIITFGKMQAKAVIKDVSRVLGLKYIFAEYLTELVPFNAINPVTLSQAIEEVKELKQAYQGKGVYNLDGEEKLIKQVLETSLILEGLHRHASTHAAGIVISNQNIVNNIPVYRDNNSEMLVVQYSMKYAELAGLVKFDFLGLQTLTVITKTVELIQSKGLEIDINKIPFDDQKTFEMLSSGLSAGVFQFESVGMKNALRKLVPDNINDIIALGALYRPGPMDNIPTYIACKHKQKEVDYLHPLLKPILKSTYGVIIYQEQVMEIARKLSGYSLGAADLLRRAMGKKVKSEMDAQQEIFVSGAVKNKVSSKQAQSIFNTVAKFAGYGFNKSHASAYGVISYQTAYLKANHPLEFLIAFLNLEMDNSDKINVFLQDAKNFDITVTPPDINLSKAFFSPNYSKKQQSIIFAIAAIKGVSVSFGREIERIREISGEFKSIIDFIERVPPKFINKRLLENIIKAGCFDSLHSNRNSLIISIPKMLAYSNSYHQEQASKQFSLISVNKVSPDLLTNTRNLDETELANLEFDVIGLYLRNHPLSHLKSCLNNLTIKNSSFLKNELPEGISRIKLFGIITKKDSRMSQRGRFITLVLSDPDGNFEVTIFKEDILKEYASLINVKQAVVVSCDVNKDKGGVRVTANKFSSIEEEVKSNDLVYKLELVSKNITDVKHILSVLKKDIRPSLTNNKAQITVSLYLDGIFSFKTRIPSLLQLSTKDISLLEERYSI